MTTSNADSMETDLHRPICVAESEEKFRVTRGVYGWTLINGRADRRHHLTLTWTSALPRTVVFNLIDPATGATFDLYVPADLLRHGGRTTNLKVDIAGVMTFLVCNGNEKQLWFCLNRQWLTEFLTKATPASPQPL